MLNVGYLNVRGLSLDKFNYAKQLLGYFDILFLAETWDVNYDTIRLDEHLICITDKKNTTGRRADGGLCVLAKPRLVPAITTVYIHPTFITVSIYGKCLTGVYLPPSLAIETYTRFIETIERSSLVLGDFNARLGLPFTTNGATTPERCAALAQWAHRRNLDALRPNTSPEAENFSHVLPSWDLAYADMPVDYHVYGTSRAHFDHPLLECRLDVAPVGIGDLKVSRLRRYHLKKLKDEDCVDRLFQCYENETDYLECWYWQGFATIADLDVRGRRKLVEDFDALLTNHIQDAAEFALGSYTVSDVKRRPDNLMDELEADARAPLVAKIFKRSMRPRATKLRSSNPDKSLKQDIFDHFAEVFVPHDDKTKHDEEEFLDGRYGFSDYQRAQYGIGDLELAQCFTVESVEKFFRDYNPAKACGPDSIHTVIAKEMMPTNLPLHLALLFQLCATVGITPRRWNTVTLYPLPKTADTRTIQQCRPIALSAMFRRCFESIVLKWLLTSEKCEKTRALSPLQGGFRRGHSCLLQAALSNDISMRYEGRLRSAYIDFKQAYDRVPLPTLLERLGEMEAPMVLRSLFLTLYTSCVLDINTNGYSVVSVPTFRGLLQGSILSPMLFNIFIDSLAKLLNQASHGEFQAALLLADDVKVHGLSDEQLQHQLDIVSTWAVDNGMVIGLDKCAHQVVGGIFELAGQALQYRRCYKYLGFPHLLVRINFTIMLQDMAAKARVILNHCRRIGTSWPEGIRLHVTKFFIRSRLEYGLPLAYASCEGFDRGYAKFIPVQQVIDDCIDWILPYVNRGVGAMLCGLNSALDRARGLGATFVYHLQRMPDDHPGRKALVYWNENRPWRAGIILPRCAMSTLHTELMASMLTPPVKNYDTALKTWYHSQLSHLRLSTYISLNARTSRNGPDRCLFIPQKHIRFSAISWRANLVWSVRYNCPTCNLQFKRSCMVYCHVLDDVLIDRYRWLADFDGNLLLPAQPPNAGANYSILDDLLNRGLYEQFQYGIDQLIVILRV